MGSSLIWFRSIVAAAQKWHPDRWASDPGAAGEAKRRFQRIQEAYSGKALHLPLRCFAARDLIECSVTLLSLLVDAVLSDKGKRAMYDAGLFDPLDDDDQVKQVKHLFLLFLPCLLSR